MKSNPTLELKKFRHSPSLSEETEAFTADLVVDGKTIASISNAGHGGCHNIYPSKPELRAELQELEKQCHELPTVKSPWIDDGLRVDLELIISELVEQILRIADLKKRLRNKIGYRLEGHDYKPGQFHVTHCPDTPENRKAIEKAGKVLEWLNDTAARSKQFTLQELHACLDREK